VSDAIVYYVILVVNSLYLGIVSGTYRFLP